MSTLSIRSRRRNLKRHVFGEGLHDPDRTDLDQAWATGFGLALDGVPAVAPKEWHPAKRASFHHGYYAGEERLREDESDIFRAEVRRYEEEEHEAAEYAEARVALCGEGGAW